MIVDIHSHFLSRDLAGKAGDYGPIFGRHADGGEFYRVGSSEQGFFTERPYTHRTPESIVKEMNKRGIDLLILSPNPLLLLHWANAETCVRFSKVQNELIADIVGNDPLRFAGMGTLPLQSMDDAISELHRMVNDLGLKGAMVSPDINIPPATSQFRGMPLDSEYWNPLYEAATDLDVPLFVHPSFVDTPMFRKYDFSWNLGFIMEETLAVASIIFGGVLDRFPRIKLVIAHGGGGMPYQIGRMTLASQILPNAKTKAKKTFDKYFKKLYFDCCLPTMKYGAPALEYLVSIVGSDHLLLGSDFPGLRNSRGQDDMMRIVNSVRSLTEEEKRKITGENAVKVFDLV